MRSWIAVFLALAGTQGSGLPGQGFTDILPTSGIVIPTNPTAYLGRAPCFGDFDRDGDQDLVFATGPGHNFLYFRNDGSGSFTDLTATCGLGLCPQAKACVAGDVDNDGDLDLYVAVLWSPNQLFLNDGLGVFTPALNAGGAAGPGGSLTASFGDYDRDGWLDLYVGNYQDALGTPQPNSLFHNNGDGTFTDATASTGAADAGLALVAFFHDYNDDGWPDIFVGNDKGYQPTLPKDTTYRNNGDGTFTDVGIAINTHFGIGAMGADFVDAFNDGGWDIFVSNTQNGHLFHVWNPAIGSYTEDAAFYGVAAFIEGWAANFLDYDNDGWQDLHVAHINGPNHLYRNPGAPVGQTAWTEVGVGLGLGLTGPQYSAAIVDIDDDGRLDVFESRPYQSCLLMRNTVSAGNWLKVETEGTVSNRDGIGARILVTTGGVTQRQTVRSGTGYISNSDLRCHFGLGSATQADRLEIAWPSGQHQLLLNVPANQILHVREPRLSLGAAPVVGTSPALQLSIPGDGSRPYAMLLALGAAPGLPLPDGRLIPLNLDVLASLTLAPGNPILPGSLGVLDPLGAASSPFVIPGLPGLIGLSVTAAAISADPLAPSGIRNILGPFLIQFE